MKRYFLILLLLVTNAIITYCQESFSLLISTQDDERIFDAAEDDNGNYYLVGKRFTPDIMSNRAYLLVVNSSGQVIFEQEFYANDSISLFGSIHIINDSIYILGAKGPSSNEYMDQLWFLVLDLNFNIILNKEFLLYGYNLVDLESIINTSGNIVITGAVGIGTEEPDILLYEISSVGDSIRRSIFAFDSGQFEYDLIELNNGGYKIFAYGNFPGAPQTWGKIVSVDSNFNYLEVDSIPYRLYFNHSAKWIDNTSYLVTGNKNIYDSIFRIDVGIARLNEDDELIVGNHFGKSGDTVSYVGACSNLDFTDPDHIYFGGASNVFPPNVMYNTENSWLILNTIDSDLNLNWQRFYGGDACYYLWGLKATQDGGCLLLATRYDELTQQEQELDAFILKVDSNGLLTSIGDQPHIPANELIIYPNPASENITVRYPDIFDFKKREVVIYNALGNEIRMVVRAPGQPEDLIDVSDFSPGLYIAVLKANGEKIAVGKFVVQ